MEEQKEYNENIIDKKIKKLKRLKVICIILIIILILMGLVTLCTPLAIYTEIDTGKKWLYLGHLGDFELPNNKFVDEIFNFAKSKMDQYNENTDEMKSLPEMHFIEEIDNDGKKIIGFCMDESLCKQDGSIGVVMNFLISKKGNTAIIIYERILDPPSSVDINRITVNCDEIYVNSFNTGWNGYSDAIGPESREIILNIANSKKTIIIAESINGVYEFLINGEEFKEFAKN